MASERLSVRAATATPVQVDFGTVLVRVAYYPSELSCCSSDKTTRAECHACYSYTAPAARRLDAS